MRVFVAEKPSVAKALAESQGQVMPGEGFYRCGDDIFTWALGHLFQLAAPEKYQSGWKRWKREDLPLLPKDFQTVPLARNKKHLAALRKILRQADVQEIINACDAGREGELIFAWILDNEKPALRKKYKRRLWLSSLSSNAIEEALRHMRPATELRDLQEAARTRAEADWLLGINATRAATLALRNRGVVSLGRVQTPTLAMLVRREKEIKNFKPETFWTVRASFLGKDGEYSGIHKEGRISQKRAKEIESRIGRSGEVIAIDKKEQSQQPPLLYDLTALQRDASSRWGWSAARTLRVAQDLYEKERVLSYPRTASRYLPESMKSEIADLEKLLPALEKREDLRRVFRDSGVGDHHAIVPVAPGDHLKGDQDKLFRLVQIRVAAALSPDALFEAQTIQTDCNNEIFESKGRRYKSWGWKEFYKSEEKNLLPRLSQGEKVRIQKLRAEKSSTKPPPRFSDGTLLGSMETAGKDVDDEEAREAMKQSGLGTPATRAAIIERLIDVEYLQRDGKALVPTSKGIEVVEALGSSRLLEAELTGQWERDLLRIEDGASAPEFMRRLQDFVREETSTLLQLQTAEWATDWGSCPGCGKPLRENRAAVSCWSREDPGCGFSLWKKIAGKTLSEKALRQLLEQKSVGPLRGFRSRRGKTFSARLALQQKDGSWNVVFDEDWAQGEE